jgi:hypothetical protein
MEQSFPDILETLLLHGGQSEGTSSTTPKKKITTNSTKNMKNLDNKKR